MGYKNVPGPTYIHMKRALWLYSFIAVFLINRPFLVTQSSFKQNLPDPEINKAIFVFFSVGWLVALLSLQYKNDSFFSA